MVQMDQLDSTQCQTFDPECSRELKDVLLDRGLLKRKPGKKDLDQRAIREVLKSIDSQTWGSVLEDLMRDGSFFMKEERFLPFCAREDLVSFLSNLFYGCVEDDLDGHLSFTTMWLHKLIRVHNYLESYLLTNFYDNNEAMARACKKRDLGTVLLLYEAGFRLNTNVDTYEVVNIDDYRLMHELSILEVRASHVYLLAEHRLKEFNEHVGYDGGTCENLPHDPVSKAMELIQICSRLARTRRVAIKKVKNIKKCLEQFLVKMLDLCQPGDYRRDKGREARNQCEIALFLNKDDNLKDISIKGTSLLPRIMQSLHLRLHDFVNHDYCQQSVRRIFYGNTLFTTRTGGFPVLLMLVTFQLLLATPVGWICYLLSKLNIIKTERLPLCLNLEVPVNQLVSHGLVQLIFAVLIVLQLVNPNDTNCVLDFDVYDGLCFAMAFGQLTSNLEEMVQVTRATKIYDDMRSSDKAAEYCKKFFGNTLYNYRLLALFSFLLGGALRAIGYHSFTRFICLKNNETHYKVIDDNHSSYEASFVEAGTCLQGIAVVLILSLLLQCLRLHPTVSAVFEGMRKCFWVVLSYAITYIVITLIFSAGIYFVLHDAMSHCTGAETTRGKDIYETCIVRGNWESNDTDCSLESGITNLVFPEVRNVSKEQNLTGECSSDETKPRIFTSFHSTTKYLFLNVYDPGYPEEIDNCTRGISSIVGFSMWYIYFFTVAIVLINLLIALMNSTLNNIETLDTWTYHRTMLWMRFCKPNTVVLPPPINLIGYMISEIRRWCPVSIDQTDGNGKDTTMELYNKLMDELVTRYENDMDTFDDNDAAINDQLEHIVMEVMKARKEVKDMKEKKGKS